MSERKEFDNGLIAVGNLLMSKRKALGKQYSSRERFITLRAGEYFNKTTWISTRHLANIEEGKNWPSIPMLLYLATALEEEPSKLFSEIIATYKKANSKSL